MQKTWLPWKQLYPRAKAAIRCAAPAAAAAAASVCVQGMRDRLLQRGGVGTCALRGGGGGGGRQTFLQGMTGIKEDEEVCVCLTVCVCQWEEGREGGVCVGGGVGCLSVLVDRAGDCSQIQLIPSGCINLSRTSDGRKRQGGKKKR